MSVVEVEVDLAVGLPHLEGAEVRPWTTEEEVYVCREDVSLIDIARELDRPLETVVTKRLALRGHKVVSGA